MYPSQVASLLYVLSVAVRELSPVSCAALYVYASGRLPEILTSPRPVHVLSEQCQGFVEYVQQSSFMFFMLMIPLVHTV